MPIALPAPAAPQLGTVETIQAAGPEYVSAAFQQTQVHVRGPDVVSKTLVEQAITQGESLSDVVRQIQALYYTAGYPSVQVSYVLAEPDLYVLVTLGKVDRIDAPAPYDAYFAGIAPAEPLTDAALEPARTLASVHADRAGERAMPVFKSGPEGTVLAIETDAQGPDKGGIGAEFGNPGNRFVGRHFVDYYVRASFGTGDEIRGAGRHALVGLEDDEDSRGYRDHSLGWSRVTPLGLFGLTGRYVNYQQDLVLLPGADPIRFDGDIRQAEASWLHLLSAEFDQRWTLGAKLDYTRKDFSTTFGSIVAQRQEYGSAEVSTEYTAVVRPLGLYTDLSAGLGLRSGLGKDKTDSPTAVADLGYLLLRPSASLRTRLGGNLSFALGLNGQITDDTLPEQQQWVIGGIGNGEAYLPGVAAGDTGGAARAQLELQLGDIGGFTLAPRIFAEYGYTRFEDPYTGQPDGDQSISDAGLALGLSYGKLIDISVSYAEPIDESGIDRSVLQDADANVYFKIGVHL